MDFELSEEQELLRSGLRELLSRACDTRRVRAVAYDSSKASDPALWKTLADAGWTAVVVPEANGGAGLRFEDLILVLEEAGRAVLPLPLTTTLLAARTLARAPDSSLRSDLLAAIAGGSASATLALSGSPGGNDDNGGCTAQREGDRWRLSGSRAFVPFGPLADEALVEAALPDEARGLFAIRTDATGIGWSDLQVMDRSAPQYEMALDGARVGRTCPCSQTRTPDR